MEENKTCPYCGSTIPANVKKCKYCGEWLVIQEKDKPKGSLHIGAWIEVFIAILSILIAINFSVDWVLSFIIAAYIVLNIYFLPTLIADNKRTKDTLAIFVLNLLLGATFIAWIICLVWAIRLPNLSKNVNFKNNEHIIPTTQTTSKNEINKDNSTFNTSETKNCPFCAELIPKDSTFCSICETSLTQNFSDKAPQIEYSSITKQINNEEIPNEIKQWNWGAFLLTWIWGIGNKSFQTFWVFVPYFGTLIWPIVCGFKGNEWAWKNKQWNNIEEFQNAQKKWAIIGSYVIVSIILLTLLCFILMTVLEEKKYSSFDSKQNTNFYENNLNVNKEENIIQKAIEEYKEEVIKETANNVGISQKCIENYFDNKELNKCSTEEKHLIKKYNDKVINENQSDDEYIDPIYTNAGMPKSLVLNGVSIMCFEKANIGDNSKCSNSELEKIKSFFKNPDDIDWEKEDVVDYPIYPDIFIDVKETQQQEGNSNQQSKEQQGVVQSKKQQVQSQTKVITPQANSTQIQQKETQKIVQTKPQTIVQPQKQIQQVPPQINKPIQGQQKSTDIDDFMN